MRQALTTVRLPVELDICDLASLVDHGVCVNTKALHVAVVQGHTNIIHQKGELQPRQILSVACRLHCTECCGHTKDCHMEKWENDAH